MKKNSDYTLGTLRVFAHWQGLRAALGCLFNGSLTPSIISAGEAGWTIEVRATRRLTKDEETWLRGWFTGFKNAVGE